MNETIVPRILARLLLFATVGGLLGAATWGQPARPPLEGGTWVRYDGPTEYALTFRGDSVDGLKIPDVNHPKDNPQFFTDRWALEDPEVGGSRYLCMYPSGGATKLCYLYVLDAQAAQLTLAKGVFTRHTEL